jgi:hypothetical protein
VKTATWHFLRRAPFSMKSLNQTPALIKKYCRGEYVKTVAEAAE